MGLCWLCLLCVAVSFLQVLCCCAQSVFLFDAVSNVMAFPPAALPAFFGTTPSSDSLSGDLPFSFCYHLSSILSVFERPDRVSRVAVYSRCPTCHALGPRRGKIAQTNWHYFVVTSAGSRASSLALNLSRLNHFNIIAYGLLARLPCA